MGERRLLGALRPGGSLADIAQELAVLLGYATVLLALAVWRFNGTLTT